MSSSGIEIRIAARFSNCDTTALVRGTGSGSGDNGGLGAEWPEE